jgi:hypothetical protein
MSVLHLFRVLNHTHFSMFMRNSRWGFAIAEMVHLLGLAALGGSILVVDLRILGVGMRRQPVARLARELWPIIVAALIVMIGSGLLLMTAFPLKYYFSPAFRLKMLLLVFAMVVYFALHRQIIRSSEESAIAARSKVAAVLSLSLWLGVGLCGRAIGFL